MIFGSVSWPLWLQFYCNDAESARTSTLPPLGLPPGKRFVFLFGETLPSPLRTKSDPFSPSRFLCRLALLSFLGSMLKSLMLYMPAWGERRAADIRRVSKNDGLTQEQRAAMSLWNNHSTYHGHVFERYKVHLRYVLIRV